MENRARRVGAMASGFPIESDYSAQTLVSWVGMRRRFVQGGNFDDSYEDGEMTCSNLISRLDPAQLSSMQD